MASYYFRRISDGEKVVERTLAAINKRAKVEATKFGQAVQVYVDKAEQGVGMRSHRQMSMARNPISHKTMYFRDAIGDPKKQYALKWVDETPYAKGHWLFNGYDGHMHFADQPIANIINHLRKDNYIQKGKFQRNPIDFAPPEYSYFQARGDARAAEVSRAQKPKRMAVHRKRGWLGGNAEPKATAAYEVRAPQLKLVEKVGTLEEAKRVAKALAKQGYSAEIHSV